MIIRPVLLLHLDPAIAGRLAVAIKREIDVSVIRDRDYPPELEDVMHALVEVARSSQERSPGDHPRMHEWLSVREVSDELGVSESTVGRRIADGTLRSSKIGRVRRIHRDDLRRLMEHGE